MIRIIVLLGISLVVCWGHQSHKVKAGESLWTIGRKYGVSVEALKAANGMTNDVLWEGKTIQVPMKEVVPIPEPSAPPLRPDLPPTPPRAVADGKSLGTEKPAKDPHEILRLQVLLDRAGFGPGVIDGKDGYFTRQAHELCKKWNPQALRFAEGPVRQIAFEASWSAYVNPSLPGTGNSPDFKALSLDQQVMAYYRMEEFIAERFHCSVGLLKTLNPGKDLERLKDGQVLLVPNVEPFEVEKYISAQGIGQWSKLVGKGAAGRQIEVSKSQKFLILWEGERLLRAFPVTVNADETPEGVRTISEVVPGPVYERKKTALNLKAGPNSPVGVIWCQLGNGYGIHGTCNPDSIGRSVSSGCIRLANWDVVRLAGMVRKGTTVRITGK